VQDAPKLTAQSTTLNVKNKLLENVRFLNIPDNALDEQTSLNQSINQKPYNVR
jgi:hypothetical protein